MTLILDTLTIQYYCTKTTGFDEDLPARVAALKPALDMALYSYNPASDLACSRSEPGEDYPCFSSMMANTPGDPLPPGTRAGVKLSDPAAFIFTSGTTGELRIKGKQSALL